MIHKIHLRACVSAMVLAAFSMACFATPRAESRIVRRVEGKKTALLIGIEQYDRPELSRVNFAIRDVQDTAKRLTALGFDARTLTSDEKSSYSPAHPSKATILKQLSQIASETGPDDILLFYYAGHEITKGGASFLTMPNTDASSATSLDTTALSVETLNAQLARIPARQIVVVMDACHGGTTQPGDVSEPKLTDDFAKSVCSLEGARTGAGMGTAILFSCDVGESAFEDPDLGHSVFASSLQKAMAGGNTKGGELELAAIAEFIKSDVAEWGKQHERKQSPWVDASGDSHVVLGRSSSAGTAPPKTANKVDNMTGSLSVSSDPPGASILIDGRDTHRFTPATIDVEVPVGGKTVTVKLQKPGVAEVEYEVSVERGKTARISAKLPILAQPAIAQPAPFHFSRSDFPEYPFVRMYDGSLNLAVIVNEQDVQREIGMDKSQRKFKEFMKATHEIMKLATPDMVNGKASRITIEEARRISECLTPFQQATLWKIMLRRTGVEAVADAAICKALGVDDRQRSDLVGNFHEFTDAYDVVMKAILRGRMKKDKMESLLETAAKNRQTLDDTIAKILTRDQRLRLQQLQDLQ